MATSDKIQGPCRGGKYWYDVDISDVRQ